MPQSPEASEFCVVLITGFSIGMVVGVGVVAFVLWIAGRGI